MTLRMPPPLLLFLSLLLSGIHAASSAAAKSGSGGVGSGIQQNVGCADELRKRLSSEPIATICEVTDRRDAQQYFRLNGSDVLDWNCVVEICYMNVCKMTQSDVRTHCSDHGFHPSYGKWRNELGPRSSLQWNIFFVIFSILLGALFRKCVPPVMPYTVALLLFFLIFGLIARMLANAQDCPWKAYRLTHGPVTRSHWDEFIGVGGSQNSFCGWLRCGDGSNDPSGCRWKFSDLDAPFSLSKMHPEMQNAGAGDGLLSADELWTPSCNLMMDMITLSDIDPHVMLVVFLPVLLFESACFGLDIGIFLMQIKQIVLMAFPAMTVAAVMTALLVWAMIPDWSFWVCLLIGVISSATDPVAVVALLKELGAPKTLGTLIEGESLLNDGSAVVLYWWVKNAIGYVYSQDAPDWMSAGRYENEVGTELVRVVAQMLLMGLLLGYIFGGVTHFLLNLVYNDRFVEGSVVIGMSYLSFWLAELMMGSSAVLAVVVMGLYLNYYKGCISPEVLEFLHQFYEMVAHGLNTVIFSIAGAKLGTILVSEDNTESTIKIYGARCLAIYPIILFARGFAVACFFPALKRLGTGCSWKEAVIMWWGGLRGSVGLALALSVFHSEYDASMWGDGRTAGVKLEDDGIKYQVDSLDCRDQPAVVLLMTLYVVSFTVIVNGMTMAPLMRFLKMTDTPDDRKFMLNEAYSVLGDKTEKYIEELKQHAASQGVVDWDKVERHAMRCPDVFAVEDEEKAAWLKVLNMERASFLSSFESAAISSEAFIVLDNHIAELAAAAQLVEAKDLPALYDKHFSELLERMKKAGTSCLYPRKEDFWDLGSAYLRSQEDVAHGLHASPERFNHIREKRSDNIALMQQALGDLSKNWDWKKMAKSRTYKAVKLCLLKQRSCIEHMLHHGQLLDLDANPMIDKLNKQLGRLYLRPFDQAVGSDAQLQPITPESDDDAGSEDSPPSSEAEEPPPRSAESVRELKSDRARASLL